MSLDIHFSEDVLHILTALNESNAMATNLALVAGADARDIQLARYVYESALAHVGIAFGLRRAELVVILRDKIVYQERG